MYRDRYDNEVTASSQAAVDAYIDGVDLILAAQAGADTALERAIAEDPAFALAHAALARYLQMMARPAEAVAAMYKARTLSGTVTPRERAHISIIGHLIDGNGAKAFEEITRHVADYPRDALAVQPCAGVFSLIGFSGRSGREAENLAFFTALKPAYGEDWWFETILAFSQIEVGQLVQGEKTIERAFAANPANGNAAHYKGHFHYEVGDCATGRAFTRDWRK